ncbi:DUF6153 family protein [Rhodococcus sp. NPDC127528]|uniref:DUF6153 family protein n=1 Tax=unclassified Rhodococcus (in: high G+C Gram-positive bacteria) TaxID=192944 RepID=UPI003637A519
MDRRPTTRRAGLARAVLLVAVVLGILAMHHVAASAAPAAMSAEHPVAMVADITTGDHTPAGHAGDHHMLNACLAILLAGTLLLLTLVLLGLAPDAATRAGVLRRVTAGSGRGPPFARATSNRLALLSILRV